MLFAVGVNAERAKHREKPAATSQETASETSGETPRPAAPVARTEVKERVLGINTETNTIVTVVVIISVLFALGIVLLPGIRGVVWGATAFCVAAAVFDGAEVAHQISRSEPGLAALATSVTAVHLATASVGARLTRGEMFVRVRAR